MTTPNRFHFRVWDKLLNIFVHGFSITGYGKIFFDVEEQDPNDYVLMQSTGLLDRDGKEIFEGDIVSIPYVDPKGRIDIETENGRSKVGFVHGQFVFYSTEPIALYDWCEKDKGEYVSNYGNLTITKDKTYIKVIGNVYENPDLLTNH